MPWFSLTFGVTALCAGVMVFSLPETFNEPLMASMEEAEDKFSNKGKATRANTEAEECKKMIVKV